MSASFVAPLTLTQRGRSTLATMWRTHGEPRVAGCGRLARMGLAFGDLELDLGTFELRRAGQRVPMEPQAFDVLVYLAQHRDRVVSKEELMDQVWGGRFVSESAVTSRIKQVRRAVGDDGQRQSVITTLHGRGYRFVAPPTDQPAAPTDPAGGPLHGGSPPPRPIGIASRVEPFRPAAASDTAGGARPGTSPAARAARRSSRGSRRPGARRWRAWHRQDRAAHRPPRVCRRHAAPRC